MQNNSIPAFLCINSGVCGVCADGGEQAGVVSVLGVRSVSVLLV